MHDNRVLSTFSVGGGVLFNNLLLEVEALSF